MAVKGIVVALVALNSTGAGQIELSSDPDGSETQALLADSPVLNTGDRVSVGAPSGTLGPEAAQETADGNAGNPEDEND